MMKQFVMTTLLAAALAAPSYAQPQAGPGPQGQGQRIRIERRGMMDQLNLTEQQETQMQKLRLDMQKKQVALQSKIRMARLELKEIYLADNPEKSAIEKKMKEISDLQHQSKIARVDHQFAVKNILTAEQQKIWKKNVMNAGTDMRERGLERRQVRIFQRQGDGQPRPGRMMQWQGEDGKEIEVEIERQ